MNQDDPYKAFNSHIKNLNKQISEIKGLVKEEKVEQKKSKKQEILERLRYVAESMRAAGATEQSIQVALKGMYEFLKVNLGEKLDQSAEKLIKNPDSAFEHKIQMPITVLSQVETQQVDWLWQRRIPLGKITILDATRAWANHYLPSSLPPV